MFFKLLQLPKFVASKLCLFRGLFYSEVCHFRGLSLLSFVSSKVCCILRFVTSEVVAFDVCCFPTFAVLMFVIPTFVIVTFVGVPTTLVMSHDIYLRHVLYALKGVLPMHLWGLFDTHCAMCMPAHLPLSYTLQWWWGRVGINRKNVMGGGGRDCGWGGRGTGQQHDCSCVHRLSAVKRPQRTVMKAQEAKTEIIH